MSVFSGSFSDALDALASNLGFGSKGAKLHQRKEHNQRQAAILAAALFVVLQFEIDQLVFMLAGAFCYWLAQGRPMTVLKKDAYSGKRPGSAGAQCDAKSNCNTYRVPPAKKACTTSEASRSCGSAATLERRQPCVTQTVVPIEAPVFKSTGFDDEVKELVSQLEANAVSKAAVQEIAAAVQKNIQQVLPEATVVGLSPSDFRKSKAFGVAVPEVDVVINIHPAALASRLQGYTNTRRLDTGKLHKAAIRTIAEILVSSGNFKFRRSAFRGSEPKITLVAPPMSGTTAESIPLDLSVNATIPFHSNALIADAGRVEARAKELILFVRRWVRDRGISHAAKGHLGPYVWTVMTIYFLQVTEDEESRLLPSLAEMDMMKKTANESEHDGDKLQKQPGVGALFKSLVGFYTGTFDWHSEAVSICAAKRSPPPLRMPLHVIPQDGVKAVAVAPSIVDPFDETHNLSDNMTRESLLRLKDEFARAAGLCKRNASLSEVLELWSPPEAEKDCKLQD
eukprot:TRINITY_DN13068_c0_g2_i1.p1 TRINITY_DN13068_c0_g2~~TRINITY_DN13068_c0_g2_i1.p1  ORF type:complete len:510 (+),score=106.15 TRINITY_DN13068_c0_g2_i1:148-1677(+)